MVYKYEDLVSLAGPKAACSITTRIDVTLIGVLQEARCRALAMKEFHHNPDNEVVLVQSGYLCPGIALHLKLACRVQEKKKGARAILGK